MAVLCSLLLWGSCDKDAVPTPGTEEEKVPITLSASSLPALLDVQTRAETINNRSIGIVAARIMAPAPAVAPDIASVDWTAIPYLDHVRANGTNTDLNSQKEVRFAANQWWPFNPAEYLAFVAYSPTFAGTGGDNRVSRVGTSNTLKVTAGTNNAFPDFLYTTAVGPYNKVTAQNNTGGGEAVSLGEFQHAMAKLDIVVRLVDKDGKVIPPGKFPDPNRLRITSLAVSTKVKNGEFDLLATPKVWTSLDNTGAEQTVRTHINSSTTFPTTPTTYTDNNFLLPGTQEESYVSITIEELHPTDNSAVNTVSLKAKITEFMVSDGVAPLRGATLEMGKTTLLTINVMYVGIPTPPDPDDPLLELQLEGQLVEWDYKGKSEMVIE